MSDEYCQCHVLISDETCRYCDLRKEVATLEAQLAEANEAVRVLGARCNVLQVLVARPVTYQVHLNGVKCSCCGLHTFELYKDDDGWIDTSKASHSTKCLVHIANTTKHAVLNNPLARASVEKAGKRV